MIYLVTLFGMVVRLPLIGWLPRQGRQDKRSTTRKGGARNVRGSPDAQKLRQHRGRAGLWIL